MKRLSIIFGLVLMLALMAIPVYPMSFQFDFNGDMVWDTEYTAVTMGETVHVDVYLDWDYVLDPSLVGGSFTYDKTKFAVDDAYLYGGCDWFSTVLNPTDGGYDISLFSLGCVSCSPDPEGKYLLATFVLQALGGDGNIRMEGIAQSCLDGRNFTPDSADAIIYGPCGVEIVPTSAEVATGKTLEFKVSYSGSACEGLTPSKDFTWEITTPENGSTIDKTGLDTVLYTAGCLVNKLNQDDTIKVTDNENGGTATAVVNILGYYISTIRRSYCYGDPQLTCLYVNKIDSGVTERMNIIETENCCPIDSNNNFQWSISDTSIGSTIITNPDGSGMYMSGGNQTDENIFDYVKVEDKNNCCGEECASRVIKVTVLPCELELSPQGSAIGAGGNIPFEVSGACSPGSYDWDLKVDKGIGSTISATGLYQAGREFLSCAPVIETIELTNAYGDPETTDVETADVEVKPCVVTISPNSAEVKTGGTIEFKAGKLLEECYEGGSPICNEPCYTWDVSAAGTTGDTTNTSGLVTNNNSVPIYTWSLGAAGATGNTFIFQAGSTAGTFMIEVTDACNDNAAHTATVEVIGTTTTTTIGACAVTISPQSKTVPLYGTIHFSAGQSGNCKDPCYDWEIMVQGSTGSTIDANGLYKAGSNGGTDKVQVTDKCNNDVSDIATVDVKTSVPVGPGPQCKSDADCLGGDIFCNGIERCVGGRCQPGSDPCPDDGLYCNGEEGCDEEEDVCTQSGDPCIGTETPICDEEKDACVECLSDEDCEGGLVCSDEGICVELTSCVTDADCDDGSFCNGEETCVDGVCQDGEPVTCEDDGEFCTGEEVCDETADACISSGDPCIGTATPDCNEIDDICQPESPLPLEFELFPKSTVRSHIVPLPLVMFIVSTDSATQFDRGSTEVSVDDVLTPPLTLVLSTDSILVLSFITPGKIGTTDSTEVNVTVTTDAGEGTQMLTLNMLPLFLGE